MGFYHVIDIAKVSHSGVNCHVQIFILPFRRINQFPAVIYFLNDVELIWHGHFYHRTTVDLKRSGTDVCNQMISVKPWVFARGFYWVEPGLIGYNVV